MNVEYDCYCNGSILCMPCFRVSMGKSPVPPLPPQREKNKKQSIKHISLMYNSHVVKPNLIFGNLTTLKKCNDKNGRVRWICFCRCGDKIIVTRMDLLNKIVTMCKDCTRLTNEC